MTTRNAAVTVLFLVLGAAGVLWFLGGDDGSQQRGGEAPRVSRPGQAEAAAPEADLTAPAAVDGDAPEEDKRVAASGPAELVAQGAPAEVAEVTPPAEDAPQLSGVVLDPAGAPIAGAEVHTGDRDGFPLDFVATGEVPGYAKRWTTATDEEGRFALRGPAPGSIRLLVRKPGFAPYEDGDVVVPEGDGFELDAVVLAPAAVLEGIVLDHVGRPVEGAELHQESDEFGFRLFFTSGMEERPAAVTDASGRFRVDELVPGAWRVRVETEDHPDRAFEGLAERGGEIVSGLRFELEPGSTIAGRVTDIPDSETSRLEIRANPKEAGDFFGFSMDGSRKAEVAEDGTFEVRGVREDTEYVLQVREEPEGWTGRGFTSRSRSVKVTAFSGDRGLEIQYQPEAAVLFQVVDAETGAPIEELRVEYGFRWTERLVDEDGRVLEDFPEGQVRIGGLRPDSEQAELEIQVDAVGYQSWTREDVLVALGQETDLQVVRLEPLPLVRVTVVDGETGEPVSEALVSIEEESEDGEDFRGFRGRRIVMSSSDDDDDEPQMVGELGRSAITADDGLAVLTSLEDRRCVIRVEHEEYATALVEGLYLPSGEAVEQRVELSEGGRVVVHVIDEGGNPVVGADVEHRPPGGSQQDFMAFFARRRDSDTRTDGEGHVTFDHLMPGLHKFRLKGGPAGAAFGRNLVMVMDGEQEEEPGWEAADVVEGGEAKVVLVETAKGALLGRVTEAGVDLVGATVDAQLKQDDPTGFGGMRMLGFGGQDGERTDSSGRYRIENLEPGTYTVTIAHPKRRMPAEIEVEVAAGETRQDIDLPVSILEGRITDLDGNPLPGLKVSASEKSGGSRFAGRVAMFRSAGGDSSGGVVNLGDQLGDAAYTDDDGRYSLRGVKPDVELLVKATGDGVQPGESESVTVGADEVRRGVDFQLEAGGTVEVEIMKADGSPASFCIVRANYLDEVPEEEESEGSEPKFAFAQSGATTLTGLRPGRWIVTVSAAGPGGDGEDPPEQEIEVEADQPGQLTFHMP
ncbi:MAG: carboxypeptidase regulatory-like domain-containing protein [Planctomycetota bacterium]